MTLDLTGCYYRRLDTDGEFQVFESTELTASGWGPNLQHGSPPMALLLKAIEELPEPRESLRIGRVALDILGPVPLEPVRVRAWIERPGRRIVLAVAEMEARANGGYRAVARASASLSGPTGPHEYRPSGEPAAACEGWACTSSGSSSRTRRRKPSRCSTRSIRSIVPR